MVAAVSCRATMASPAYWTVSLGMAALGQRHVGGGGGSSWWRPWSLELKALLVSNGWHVTC